MVLLGESGCGKTTTLRLVNRLLAPTSGDVFVEGKATSAWDPISLRRRTGYVIQEAGLFPHFTIEENIALVPSLERWDESRIREPQLRENFAWLNRFALSLLKQHPGKDSIAMKRRGCGWSDDFLLEVLTGTTT